MSRLRSTPWFGPRLNDVDTLLLRRDLVYALCRPCRPAPSRDYYQFPQVGSGVSTPGEQGEVPKPRHGSAYKLEDDSREQLKKFFDEHPEVTSWTPIEGRTPERMEELRVREEIHKELDSLWHKMPFDENDKKRFVTLHDLLGPGQVIMGGDGREPRILTVGTPDPSHKEVWGGSCLPPQFQTATEKEIWDRAGRPAPRVQWVGGIQNPELSERGSQPLPNGVIRDLGPDDSDPLADIRALQARMDAMTQVIESLQSTLRSNVRLTDQVRTFILDCKSQLQQAWTLIDKAGNGKVQWGGEAANWRQAATLFRQGYLDYQLKYNGFVKEWLLPDEVALYPVIEPKPVPCCEFGPEDPRCACGEPADDY